jgi:hypothetical protein
VQPVGCYRHTPGICAHRDVRHHRVLSLWRSPKGCQHDCSSRKPVSRPALTPRSALI